MYNFLPEQIENLKRQLKYENEKFNDILEIRKENYLERKTGQGEEARVLFDSSLLQHSFMNVAALNDVKEKLQNCKIIERNNSDEIGIGSTFEIVFDDEDNKSTFTLIETKLSKDPVNFISISSPLGKAVIGKTQGDNFSYSVEKSIISGRINKIIKIEEDVKTKCIRK